MLCVVFDQGISSFCQYMPKKILKQDNAAETWTCSHLNVCSRTGSVPFREILGVKA
jgi:hypothetical protein